MPAAASLSSPLLLQRSCGCAADLVRVAPLAIARAMCCSRLIARSLDESWLIRRWMRRQEQQRERICRRRSSLGELAGGRAEQLRQIKRGQNYSRPVVIVCADCCPHCSSPCGAHDRAGSRSSAAADVSLKPHHTTQGRQAKAAAWLSRSLRRVLQRIAAPPLRQAIL